MLCPWWAATASQTDSGRLHCDNSLALRWACVVPSIEASSSCSVPSPNTGETNLAGALLRAAIGNNLSTYLEHKIWQPFGMEFDATWMLHESAGGELGGCCISATLRDYARIGIFAMRGGELPDGTRVLPESWMTESTTPSKGFEGYGYLWWLRDDGAYAGLGIFGQLLWIHPASELVIVTHSAWPTAVGRELSEHRWALVEALAAVARG